MMCGEVSSEQVMAGWWSVPVRDQRSGQCVCCGFQHSVMQTTAEQCNCCLIKVSLQLFVNDSFSE